MQRIERSARKRGAVRRGAGWRPGFAQALRLMNPNAATPEMHKKVYCDPADARLYYGLAHLGYLPSA